MFFKHSHQGTSSVEGAQRSSPNVSSGWQDITVSNQAVQIRTSPPSDTANNQDVFLWALYVLGGADRDVDVEDIYLKCFEMAPARLGWRTQPQLPQYKKLRRHLNRSKQKRTLD